jgi:hypothetical protein
MVLKTDDRLIPILYWYQKMWNPHYRHPNGIKYQSKTGSYLVVTQEMSFLNPAAKMKTWRIKTSFRKMVGAKPERSLRGVEVRFIGQRNHNFKKISPILPITCFLFRSTTEVSWMLSWGLEEWQIEMLQVVQKLGVMDVSQVVGSSTSRHNCSNSSQCGRGSISQEVMNFCGSLRK